MCLFSLGILHSFMYTGQNNPQGLEGSLLDEGPFLL